MGFESLGKKLAQFGQDTRNSVAKLGENYQMNSKLSDARKNLDGLFGKLGAAVAEKFADGGLEGFEEDFEAIKLAKQAVADIEEQIQKMKGVVVCPECGKEAAKGERFCSACGAKLPEEEDPAEKLKKDALEAGNEVGDMVNEAADKAKDFFGSFADKAGAFMQGVTSKLGSREGREEVANDIREKAEDLFEDAKEAAKDIQKSFEDAAGEAEEAAEDACECAGEAAEEAADAAEEACECAADAAEEAADAAEEAAECAADAAEEACECAADAVEEAADAAEEVKDAVEE